jgi:large repetitive protein
LSLNRWLFLLTTFGALVLPVAAAQADATWTGASTSPNWSDSTNWSGTTPPTGTLSFPTLGPCGTCYTSNNDLTGISATSLVLGNASSQYRIKGNTFTVGSGGINDTPGHGTGVVITARIALSDSQTWVVGTPVSNGYNSLTLLGGVTGGNADAVTLSMPNGDLFVDSDMEAGPVTSQGPGGLHIGGAPGLNEPGSINGSNGQPVTVNGGLLIPNPGSKSGPLSITGGTLLLGTNTTNTGTTTLDVNGAAMLGSSTTMSTFIDDNGSTPGTDFSQLSASGNIALGGKLVLGQGQSNGQCVTLGAGDVATLVTTTGTLSGTFSNAPEGTTLTMSGSCQSTPPKLQIHYTSGSVTATVVGTPTIQTTTTLATPNPSPSSTNQTVTLTATVTTNATGTVAPAGTVAFSGNAGTISGCTSRPLTVSGSSGTATCTTSFPASASPESLTAAFNPATGSGQVPSSSSAQALSVNPAATTTSLQASNSSPPVGTSVTYTAAVTPANAGASKPSGTVAFLDGGSAISACTAQPLTAGSQSSSATCTVTYPAAGSHTITAGYGADANFTGSTSSSTTVTVVGDTSTTKLAPPSPSPAATNQPVTLTATVTGTSAPKGTVAFLANGSAIADCAGRPLITNGSSGTATCHASFSATGSPESLSAAFTPADGSGQGPSTSSPQTLTVNPAATTTSLQASNSSPPAGTSVTYTATVAPTNTGASQPSGTIAFSDGGSPISGCTAQPLTTGSSTSTATCTVSYAAPGSHTVTARYSGDHNFTGSSSSSTTVTVQPTPTPPGGGGGSGGPAPGGGGSGGPAPGGSGSTGPAPGVGSGTPPGRAGVVLSRVAQSHIRWRKPHARRASGAGSVPLGTRFTFRVSRAARVTFTFVQTLAVRRLGARCVAPRKAKGRAPACDRPVTRGGLVRSVGAGAHHLTFHGRVGRTTLPAGSYAVLVTAVAPSGARSRTITLHFTIVA